MDYSKRCAIPCQSVFLATVCTCVLLLIMLMNYQSNTRAVSPSGQSHSMARYPHAFAHHYQDIQERSRNEVQPFVPPPNFHPRAIPAYSNITEDPPCTPKQRIVFLKTHKTASTTMTSIFQRYGYYRNSTFAVGKRHILSYQYGFNHTDVMPFPGMNGQPFDMLVNHAHYNRPEMDVVVPNATYITIVRRPENQIDSAFGYFEMYRGMGLGKKYNPLKTFMYDPMKYYKNHKYKMWQLSRNGMLYDMGFDHKHDEDRAKILEKILELAKEFDLVLLADYFDESLILMKKMLCWDYEDILYLPNGVRSNSHRYEKDEKLKAKLRAWSSGDVLLYDAFNRTFWNKVADYGPTFGEDVAHLRNMYEALFEECIAVGNMDKKDRRVEKYTLKNDSEKCKAMLRGDVDYTKLIRKSMMERFGAKPS